MSLTLSPFALVFIAVSAVEATALVFVLKRKSQRVIARRWALTIFVGCDAIVVGVAGYSVSCFLAISSVFAGTMNHELVVVLGLGIAIYGLVTFVMERVFEPEEAVQEPQDVQLEVSSQKPASIAILIRLLGVSF